jgi:DNA helicase II / ATP-dependent DNA helicase PcrA
MGRRGARAWSQAFETNAETMTGALTWTGTFHAVGARLLRDYAEQIRIDSTFTIHDREDSDLSKLICHELGLSKMKDRFPPRVPALPSTPAP